MAENTLFNFLIDGETRDKLEFMAAATERTQAAYLRWLIRRAHQEYLEAHPAPSNGKSAPEPEAA